METPSFTALPVAQGDAFLVSRESSSALIDGGRSRRELRHLLSQAGRPKTLDVVVCTHNDADHANGLIGLLNDNVVRVAEVWLPGQWTTRLLDLLVVPIAFMHEVLVRIDSLSDQDRRRSLSELGDLYGQNADQDGEGPTVADVIDQAVEGYSHPMILRQQALVNHLPFLLLPLRRPLDTIGARLFWEAFDAAKRIRALAHLAWRRAALVRFFDVASGPASPANSILTPVNATEVLRVSAAKPDALTYLALSISNKRSLCFHFRASEGTPTALLTADSDLCFAAAIPWNAGMIITAPHHGSEANAKAYSRATTEHPQGASSIWIRSDGHFRSRPGPAFLSQSKRYCTRCRPYGQSAQEVRFISDRGTWRPDKTSPCACM